jgi:prepilin-type processing-associated H-X9-DG protein
MRRSHGFTIIELVFVLGIILVLVGLLAPSLSGVFDAGRRTSCLNNLRQLQVAHYAYLTDHDGGFIDAALPHGGLGDEDVAWLATLAPYYGDRLIVRSPLDRSPHWPADEGGRGVPLTGTTDRFRRTSYGLNNYLTRFAAVNEVYDRLSRVSSPPTTVHFIVMSFEGAFAGSDHCHAEGFWLGPQMQDFPPHQAPEQGLQIDAVKGPAKSWGATSNYGFLDGHVATHTFGEVYVNLELNSFDPAVSRFVAARRSG